MLDTRLHRSTADMSMTASPTAIERIFATWRRAQLAGALKPYMSDILSDDRVKGAITLDILEKCRELKARSYTQASTFLELLDSQALSPQAVTAVQDALLDAKAGHLLNGGVGKLSATATVLS